MYIFDYQKMKALRIKHGYTQEELATKAEMTKNFIGNIERGKCNMSLLYFQRLAEVLNVDPSELLISKINTESENKEFFEDFDCKQISDQINCMLSSLNKNELISVFNAAKNIFNGKVNRPNKEDG